jgi:DNA adenine methylase
MKTPITYYGGKQNLISTILPLILKDKNLYCEPFFGGGAVFFAK